jgi:hypothetical protein
MLHLVHTDRGYGFDEIAATILLATKLYKSDQHRQRVDGGVRKYSVVRKRERERALRAAAAEQILYDQTHPGVGNRIDSIEAAKNRLDAEDRHPDAWVRYACVRTPNPTRHIFMAYIAITKREWEARRDVCLTSSILFGDVSGMFLFEDTMPDAIRGFIYAGQCLLSLVGNATRRPLQVSGETKQRRSQSPRDPNHRSSEGGGDAKHTLVPEPNPPGIEYVLDNCPVVDSVVRAAVCTKTHHGVAMATLALLGFVLPLGCPLLEHQALLGREASRRPLLHHDSTTNPTTRTKSHAPHQSLWGSTGGDTGMLVKYPQLSLMVVLAITQRAWTTGCYHNADRAALGACLGFLHDPLFSSRIGFLVHRMVSLRNILVSTTPVRTTIEWYRKHLPHLGSSVTVFPCAWDGVDWCHQDPDETLRTTLVDPAAPLLNVAVFSGTATPSRPHNSILPVIVVVVVGAPVEDQGLEYVISNALHGTVIVATRGYLRFTATGMTGNLATMVNAMAKGLRSRRDPHVSLHTTIPPSQQIMVTPYIDKSLNVPTTDPVVVGGVLGGAGETKPVPVYNLTIDLGLPDDDMDPECLQIRYAGLEPEGLP